MMKNILEKIGKLVYGIILKYLLAQILPVYKISRNALNQEDTFYNMIKINVTLILNTFYNMI